VIGADNVARVLASIFPLLARIEASVEPRKVNGHPGAIVRDRDGKVVGTLALDVLDGQVQMIRAVVNPDKLGHLGPVADAWAISREVKQARRPTTDPAPLNSAKVGHFEYRPVQLPDRLHRHKMMAAALVRSRASSRRQPGNQARRWSMCQNFKVSGTSR
jgi:hypothetical protein